ncbi:MAG: hypothetical protein ACTHJ3_13380 [Pararhizobium sp.]
MKMSGAKRFRRRGRRKALRLPKGDGRAPVRVAKRPLSGLGICDLMTP